MRLAGDGGSRWRSRGRSAPSASARRGASTAAAEPRCPAGSVRTPSCKWRSRSARACSWRSPSALESSGRVRVFGLAAALALLCSARLHLDVGELVVAPSNSWLEANRTLAYAATFAGAIALVRLAAGRWRSMIAGVLLAAVLLSAYAVASEDPPRKFARRVGHGGAPPGSVRLLERRRPDRRSGHRAVPMAGARREGHGVLAALAAPALCVLLVALVLSYSRGAVLAAAISHRLLVRRGAPPPAGAVVLPSAASRRRRSSRGRSPTLALQRQRRSRGAHRRRSPARPGARRGAGARLRRGAGAPFRRRTEPVERGPPAEARDRGTGRRGARSCRRHGAMAHSSRGVFGEISHGWHQLTTPNAQQPSSNGDPPDLGWKHAGAGLVLRARRVRYEPGAREPAPGHTRSPISVS